MLKRISAPAPGSRYVLRPPIAQERLSRTPDGRVLLTLKTEWSPIELLDRPRSAHGHRPSHSPGPVNAYMRDWKKNPTPFVWTKPAAAIIKSHRRA